MLSWYICEERDSAKKLRAAYDCVRAGAEHKQMSNGNGAMAQKPGTPSADAQAIMACLADGFARLEKKLDKVAHRSKA